MKVCPVCSREFPQEQGLCPHDGAALVALRTGSGQRPEDLLGQVVDGRYRIEQIVGRGGMGTVYAVRHVVVGKLAAMKVLRAGLEGSEGVLQRFIREAQTANAIRSRHIVEMTDFGQLPNGSFYVVMELLEGDNFARLMRARAFDAGQLFHIFIQVASALELAHRAGVVHRDLKPDNVFLVEEHGDPLFVKLLDFGIAKVIHAEASSLTETGVILGTPYYMSPEQARAENVDHRSDIYALGVMMYRAFTGRLPFVADSTMGVLTAHLTAEPELPSRLSSVDVPTERIILRCLEKKKEARFQSMAEVVAALQAIASVSAHPTVVDPTTSGRVPASSSGAPASWSERAPAAVSGAYPTSGHSGAYPVAPSYPHLTPTSGITGPPGSGSMPEIGAHGLPIVHGGPAETGTAQALVTSATGRVRVATKPAGVLGLAIAGAAAMLLAGGVAALAFAGWRGASGPADAVAPAREEAMKIPVEVEDEDEDEPVVSAEPAPVEDPPLPAAASAMSSATSAPPSSAPTTPLGGAPPSALKGPLPSPPTKSASPPVSASPPPPPPAKLTSPEVRSPFE